MRSRRRFRHWLIADLDGTYLGGSTQAQQQLNSLMSSGHSEIGLIYCSGRSLAKISPLIEAKRLPEPSAIIGDVGTGLWEVNGRSLSTDFDRIVADRWAGSRPRVLERLRSLQGLELQTGTGPHRCSFVYSKKSVAEIAAKSVRKLRLDPLISGGCYFDVLPKGVNKGFAVKFLMDLWGLDPQQVLVAGDTLNDLSMLSLAERIPGLNAVAVGNADEELRAHFRPSQRAVYAQGHGAEGICERLEQLGWVN